MNALLVVFYYKHDLVVRGNMIMGLLRMFLDSQNKWMFEDFPVPKLPDDKKLGGRFVTNGVHGLRGPYQDLPLERENP
jgi:hypothetical protein